MLTFLRSSFLHRQFSKLVNASKTLTHYADFEMSAFSVEQCYFQLHDVFGTWRSTRSMAAQSTDPVKYSL